MALVPKPTDLEHAESELLTFAAVLDEPIDDSGYKRALIGLGHRARSLFRGSLELHRASDPVAARALLRPMVEANLVVRFLSKSPELHTELWHAESARIAAATAREQLASANLTERWGRVPITDQELEPLDERVRQARKGALEANVIGVGDKGQVFPSVSQQLATIRECAAEEAYTFAYRVQSSDVHNGPRAVQDGEWVQHCDGRVSYRDILAPRAIISLRLLAITVFASTLELVSHELGSPGEERARAVRCRFVPAEIPAEQRLDAMQQQE